MMRGLSVEKNQLHSVNIQEMIRASAEGDAKRFRDWDEALRAGVLPICP